MTTMAKPPQLPSARIRCDTTGWVRVGDKTYLSATDALTAYMQQFDGSHARSNTGVTHSTPSIPESSMVNPLNKMENDHTGVGAFRPSSSNPANITQLLIGSPNDLSLSRLNGLSLNNVSNNLISLGLQPEKHSLSVSAHDNLGARLSPSTSAMDYVPAVNRASLRESVSSHRQTHNGIANSQRISHQAYYADLSQGLSYHSSSSVLPSAHTPAHNGLTADGFLENGYSNGFDQSGQNHRSLPVLGLTMHTPGSKCPKSEVEVLLTSSMRTSKEFKTMSEDTLREVKLKRLLREAGERSLQKKQIAEDKNVALKLLNGESPQSLSPGSSAKSGLQYEVEEALSKSAQLLQTIKSNGQVSPRCISDIGSLNTEALLSVDPYTPAEAISSTRGRERESRCRHRYSYHTPRHHARSLSLGPAPSMLEQERFNPNVRGSRRRSVDSLQRLILLPSETSPDEKKKTISSNTSVSSSSDPSDIISRPAQHPSQRNKGGPPSWIQELIPPAYKSSNYAGQSGAIDSVFSHRDSLGARQIPSWIQTLEHSDVSSTINTHDQRDAAEGLAMGVPGKAQQTWNRADDTAASDLSFTGPGLNYSDLAAPPTKYKVSFSHLPPHPARTSSRLSRNNSFSGTGSVSSRLGSAVHKEADRGKPRVTSSSRFHQDLAGMEVGHPQPPYVPPSLGSCVRVESPASLLRKKVSEDSVQARCKMNTFLAELSKAEDKPAALPRCSSVELLNGTSRGFDLLSDVTGASTIAKDSNFSSKLCLEDPTLNLAPSGSGAPVLQREGTGDSATGNSPDETLDGDRSWEKAVPSFKAPVQVGTTSATAVKRPETPTLSGGQQPGSMEALKQMLFRLQNEESSAPSPTISCKENEKAAELIPALKDYDFEVEPGGQSLERALVHLSRLKTLVAAGTTSSTDHCS